MASLFVKGKLVDPYIIALASILLRAKGHLWHKSSMIKGAVRRSGIDTDARWGFSHTKQWIFGYKLHITSSTGSLIKRLICHKTLNRAHLGSCPDDDLEDMKSGNCFAYKHIHPNTLKIVFSYF